MNRRNFVRILGLGSSVFAAGGIPFFLAGNSRRGGERFVQKRKELSADVVIAGAGIGGFAAAMAALRNGQSVILTEETDWIGGQFTQQGLSCPDEHPWIETHGATQLYRDFRTAIREYYRKNYHLTDAARAKKNLNPGDGLVSGLCFEPKVALAVFYNFLAPYFRSGKLHLLLQYKILEADVTGDRVTTLIARHTLSGDDILLMPQNWVIFYRLQEQNM